MCVCVCACGIDFSWGLLNDMLKQLGKSPPNVLLKLIGTPGSLYLYGIEAIRDLLRLGKFLLGDPYAKQGRTINNNSTVTT